MPQGVAELRGGRALTAPGLLCFFLVAMGCPKQAPPAPPPPPAAALVDGVPITVAALQRELDRLRRGEVTDEGHAGIAQGTGAPPAAQVAQAPQTQEAVAPDDLPRLAQALLEPLIDRAILLHRAQAAGLTVSDAEVQRATDALAEAARGAGQPFTERLAQDGETREGLAEEMRARLLAEKYVQDEVRKERASPTEVRAWFEQHHADFDTPEEAHALQITVSSAAEAKSVLDQLRKGAPFGELARTHSSSPDAQRGGDLGWFPRGTMPKAFDLVCFTLAPGKLSGVVESPYGFHLFRVLARRGARRHSLEEEKVEAERRATAEKRAEAERQLIAQARKKAVIRVDPSSFVLLH